MAAENCRTHSSHSSPVIGSSALYKASQTVFWIFILFTVHFHVQTFQSNSTYFPVLCPKHVAAPDQYSSVTFHCGFVNLFPSCPPPHATGCPLTLLPCTHTDAVLTGAILKTSSGPTKQRSTWKPVKTYCYEEYRQILKYSNSSIGFLFLTEKSCSTRIKKTWLFSFYFTHC